MPVLLAILATAVAAVTTSLAPVSIPKSWSARERTVAQAVSAAGLAAHVRFLSDDLLEGRGPGTRGDELAMKYIAAQLERLGLEPAGDHHTFFQRFEVVGVKNELAQPLSARGPKGTLALHPPTDAIVVAGNQKPSAELKDAEVVFVGYGITAPEETWDDYQGVDVRGKVVLVMNNDPAGDPSLFAGKTRLYYGRWTYKYEEAARHGAAGAIVIHTTPSAGYPWQVVQTSWSGEQFELPRAGEPRLAVKMWLTDEAARKLVALGGQELDALRTRAESRDFHPVALGVTLSTSLRTTLRRFQTANVLGLLPGADARLSKELVVYSAHHDHLGIRTVGTGPAIYHGALDNASGVAALLQAASALTRAKPRPARSILFAAVGVEEAGLLGSEYFCRHPIVPAGRIAADLNFDGVNIFGRTRDVELIGLGKSTLDAIVGRAAAAQNRTLKPDQFPDRGYFYRSDQFSFARIGVPGVYLNGGLDMIGRPKGWGRARVEEYIRTRYHQPSDVMDATWNLDGAVDDLRLMTTVGLRIADAPTLPSWRPGDEFEAARKRALEELKR
ncbi:MAG TPA: M28 family peptidase [Polyangia bacterium]